MVLSARFYARSEEKKSPRNGKNGRHLRRLFPLSLFFFYHLLPIAIFRRFLARCAEKKTSDVATKMHPGCEEQEKGPLDRFGGQRQGCPEKRKRDGGA